MLTRTRLNRLETRVTTDDFSDIKFLISSGVWYDSLSIPQRRRYLHYLEAGTDPRHRRRRSDFEQGMLAVNALANNCGLMEGSGLHFRLYPRPEPIDISVLEKIVLGDTETT